MLDMLKMVRKDVPPLKLVLRTNFTMPLNEEVLLSISEAFDELVASMDGTEESHNARRGDGSYEKLMKTLEAYSQLSKSDCAVRKNYTMAELSLASVMRTSDIASSLGDHVRSVARNLGIKRIRFRPILPIGRAEDWDEPPTSEALGGFVDPIDLMKSGFQPVKSCGLGQNLYVEPSGEFFPCYAYHRPHSYLGNVIKDGLESVVVSDKFMSLRRHTVDTNSKCHSCIMRYLCGGACRAWGGEQAQHDLDAPPKECSGLRERAENLYNEALKYLGLMKGLKWT
jgi:uncharacterized protein